MDRQKLIETLEQVDEGFRPKVYNDSKGIPTVGIGRNLRDTGVSHEEAYILVHNDIDGVEADLDHRLPWWRRLDEVRQQILANMCFQMGVARLLQFEKALAAMMIGDFEKAADEMLDSQWAREDSPKRAHRLADEMRKGEAYALVG